MINYAQALAFIENHSLILNSCNCRLENSLNQICAENIFSQIMLPPFHNSNMDGFALRALATQSATKNNPLYLNVCSTIAAGDALLSQVSLNSCYEIMTGAPIPAGYDCVIPIEEVSFEKNIFGQITQIVLERPVNQYENMRLQGSDFPKGKCVIEKGERISAEKIMLLAALGISLVKIFEKVKVVLLSTGKELIDDFDIPLQGAQIYNSNTPYLAAALQEFPVQVTVFNTIADDVEQFHKTMDKIEEQSPHILITTGAVSAGKWDFIPTSLQERNAQIFFHKTAIKPGKPILFAKLKSGTTVFALPGNPISTAVGFRFFVAPFLQKIFSFPKKEKQKVILTSTGKKKKGMTFFLKSQSFFNAKGQICARILQGQESFRMHPLLETNGWIALEDHVEEYKSGDVVAFIPLK